MQSTKQVRTRDRSVILAALALALAGGIATSACQPAPPGRTDSAAEAPASPSRVDDPIHASMWELAAEIRLIDSLVRDSEKRPRTVTEERIRSSLDRMRVAAERLQPPRVPAHPVLGIHLDDFLLRLDQAQLALDRTPPDFYRAAALAGGCFLCHELESERAELRDPMGRRAALIAIRSPLRQGK